MGSRDSLKRGMAYGCTGCLAIVGVLVLFVAATAGIALLKARSEQVEERDSAHDLAAHAETGTAARPGDAAGAVERERAIAGAAAGKVLLELSHSEIYVEPGEPGEPLRVRARYDDKAYELSESFETPPGMPWTYTMSFRRTAPGLMTTLKELFGGTAPQVRVFLPPGVPMELEIHVQEGGSAIRLDGLWLTTGVLRLEKGGVDLEINEPLRAPMESLSIRSAMGGFSASRLGNASPRKLDVECRMGGMDLDLRGDWLGDSQVSIVTSMAGGAVRLPRNANVRGLDNGRWGLRGPSEPELAVPTLTLSVSTAMGDLEIVD